MKTAHAVDPLRRTVHSSLEQGGSARSPVLYMDAGKIRAAFSGFVSAMPSVLPFYAVKCNPAPSVLRVLQAAGCGFEVASVAEVELLSDLGVDGHELLFSNPVRGKEQSRRAFELGVHRFAADSDGELRRLSKVAPGACVYVRLATRTNASVVPSEGKFGVDRDRAVELLLMARELALVPYGLAFHVGSQMLGPSAWDEPIEACGEAMSALLAVGVRVQMIDIGGGFPAAYTEAVPGLGAFGDHITEKLAGLPYPVDVAAEPGRCLVAEAGAYRCRVLGVVERPSGSWVHVDLGVFNGMMEVLESSGRLRYPMWDSRRAPSKREYNVTGPTCDSQDTIGFGVLLSEDLDEGDEIYIGSAGAYTAAYASEFNGFSRPHIVTA